MGEVEVVGSFVDGRVVDRKAVLQFYRLQFYRLPSNKMGAAAGAEKR